MARNSSALMSSAWLCISVAFLILPQIDGGDPTPCGEFILLDADQPTAQITDEYYRLGGTDDDARKECFWYFHGPPGTTIRLDAEALGPMTEPFIVYDGLGIETDNDQGIQLGGGHENTFISSGRGLTCKLPTTSNDTHQETSVTLQATLQGEMSIEGAIPGECGGTINLDQHSPISRFDVTNSYSSGGPAYCNWYINSPPNTMIVVEFYDWQLVHYYDYMRIYDSSGREIFFVRGRFDGARDRAPHQVISDSSANVRFDAYNDVSDSYFGVKVSYIDELRHNDAGVLPSSGGVIELNENTTPLTVQSMNVTIPYYGYMKNYWFVTGPVGRRLKVEFHQLNAGVFYVYDSSSQSGIVSRFSSPSIMPEDRVFSQNAGTLYFQFQGTYGGVGLLFTISITDEYPVVGQQTCGGRVELDHYQEYFVFNSPYYYSQQPVSGSVDCYWYVTSPAGKQVQLEWLDIDTSDDYVRVYDHPSSQNYPVSQLRGNVDPDLSPFVSTRGGITFALDDYSGTNDRGFLANFSLSDGTSVVGPRSCGGTIRLSDSMPEFTLNSPYYMYYPPSSTAYMRCFWHVHAPSGQEVHLKWLDIDNPTRFVYLYDNPSSNKYIVSSYGDIDVDISPVVSSRGGWTVQYTDSYSGNNGRGFLAEFSLRDTPYYSSAASCGGTIPLTQSSPNVTFFTPYYYQPSTSNVVMDCLWYITSPSGKQVQLTVLDLETGSSEKIYIYDHPTFTNYLLSILSGRLESPATILSSRGGVIVCYYDFSSSYNGPGVLFEARILDAMPSEVSGFCGGVIPLSTSTPRVTTTTPLYNRNSASDVNIDCWWYVTSPSGKQVEMSIHDLQTENEYVYLHDYPSSSSSSYQVSHLRGNVSDSTVVSTRGGFSVEFNDASSSRNGHGFAMDVALTDGLSWDSVGIDSCGQTVHLDSSSPSIVFRTPTYPVEVVNDQYTCYWYLTCPYGYRISLLFNDFDTFSGSRFRVYDSSSVSSTYQLAEISSSSTPGSAAIQSSSNSLTLYYNDADWSDVTRQRGILAGASIVSLGEPTWDQVEPMSSCGSAVSLTDQDSRITLTTPDYPHVNGDYYECTWFVECPSQTAVRIDVNDFWLDSNGYLRVHDGPNTGYSVIQHSTGSSIPDSVVSSSNVMTVYYYNNRGTSGKGASFEMSCVFEVNLDCDSTSMTVFLDRRLLSNGTNAEDVHFENDDCVGINHDTTQIVLYTRYDRCSTKLQETETSIIYSNVVTYNTPRPIPGTEITRENILKIPVKCELDRHRLLRDSFVPKIGEIVLSETGYGDFSLRLDRYTDATFDEFAGDDEGEIILGDHLYFAVNLTSVPGLTVFIDNCWATPSQYPNDAKSYNFLDNGCSEDPTMHKLYSPDPSFSKFVIDAFTFIEENPQVFIHCEVLVCNNNDPSSRCSQGCKSRFRRGSRHTRGTSSTSHLISNGPLSTVHTMHAAEAHNSDSSPVSMESGILIGVLACITCLLVAMVAVVLYLIPARHRSQHGYYRVKINEDDE